MDKLALLSLTAVLGALVLGMLRVFTSPKKRSREHPYCRFTPEEDGTVTLTCFDHSRTSREQMRGTRQAVLQRSYPLEWDGNELEWECDVIEDDFQSGFNCALNEPHNAARAFFQVWPD